MALRYEDKALAIDYDAIFRAGGLGKGSSRYDEKIAKRAAARKAERECYRVVDARDGHQCRVCGRQCSLTAIPLVDRAERHHMIPRSLGGKHEPSNVVTTCKGCHERVHLRGDMKLSGDAQLRDDRGRLCGVTVEELTESGWVTTRVI